MHDWYLVIGVLVCSAVLTGIVRSYSLNGGLMDTPNQRSSHNAPTPRGGGLSIAISFSALLIFLYLTTDIPDEIFYALIAGGGLVGGIGFVDDHRGVPALYRFFAHILAASVVVYLTGGLPPLQFGAHTIDLGWGGQVLSVVCLVWLTNLFNFMDGIDGIAAMETIFIACSAFIISNSEPAHYLMVLEMGLALACVGFLFWNWPPAKIFMGDVGSGFLGIILGGLAFVSAQADDLPIWTWLILSSVFIVDATVTVVRRMVGGEKWYKAHRSHAYQRAARRFQSHKKVTVGVSIMNVTLLFPLAWYSAAQPEHGWLITLMVWIFLCAVAIMIGAGRPDSE